MFSFICKEFQVVAPRFQEQTYISSDVLDITHYVLKQAKGKLDSVQEDADIIVAADTVVYIPSSDTILGKPSGEKEALKMLKMLVGRSHRVITGVAMRIRDKVHLIHESTQVKFRIVPDSFLQEYVATGMPLDKAGAYGIQDLYGAILVEAIVGDYYNVVGFPVGRVWEVLSPYIST